MGTFWIPNVAKQQSKIDPKNDIEKRWFQGGPGASGGSRARVQKEQLSKRFGYLEDWKIGGKEERMVRGMDDRIAG